MFVLQAGGWRRDSLEPANRLQFATRLMQEEIDFNVIFHGCMFVSTDDIIRFVVFLDVGFFM